MLDKPLTFLIILSIFISCNKKKVELPIIPITTTSNITDISEIWVFYDVKNEKNKANVNLNNIISTTNWIINIDKKLLMKEIVPVIQTIKSRREKKSIHSAEGKSDYLSYANNKDKNISFFKIDQIQYLQINKADTDNLSIHYKTDHNLFFREKNISFNKKEISIDSLKIEDFNTQNSRLIHVFFDENITYQSYLEKRIKLSEIIGDKFKIDDTEYILLDR